MKRTFLLIVFLNCIFFMHCVSLSARAIAESGIDRQFHGTWEGSVVSSTDEDNIEPEKIKLEISSTGIKLYLIDNIKTTTRYFDPENEEWIDEDDPNSTYGQWIEVVSNTASYTVWGENIIYNWIISSSYATVSGILSLSLLNKQVMDVVYLRHIQNYDRIRNTTSAYALYYSGQLYQQTEQPVWVSGNMVYIDDGIVYFRGYAENSQLDINRTESRAVINAQAQIIAYMKENDIEFPIPANARIRRSVNSIIANSEGIVTSVRATFSDFKIVDSWIDSEGGMYVLCSSSGIE